MMGGGTRATAKDIDEMQNTIDSNKVMIRNNNTILAFMEATIEDKKQDNKYMIEENTRLQNAINNA